MTGEMKTLKAELDDRMKQQGYLGI